MRDQYAAIEALHTRVVIISFSADRLARRWLRETGVPFPLWLDPAREAYRAYGLERSLLRSWGWQTWLRYAQLLLAGRKWRGIQDDSAQLGGDFIVDRDGILRFAYPSRNPTDRPPLSQLLALLRQLPTP